MSAFNSLKRANLTYPMTKLEYCSYLNTHITCSTADWMVRHLMKIVKGKSMSTMKMGVRSLSLCCLLVLVV